jgi:hypothetical protein
MARLQEAGGCCVLLPTVPTAGDLAQSARDILPGYKDQHGTEQHDGFLKDPVLVKSLCLTKPERLEALGLLLLLARLLWRVRERAMRTPVDTPSAPLPGWDKTATERPTSVMMVTKFASVIVLKRGHHRHLARPLSGGQHQDLTARDVPATCCTRPAGEQRRAMAARRLARRHQRILQWFAADPQRTRGLITSRHQDLGGALPGDKGNIRRSLHPREARGLMVLSRSPGGTAESLWLTPEGQQGASQLT